MDREILQKTTLSQLLLEKTEWLENELSFQGDSSTNDFCLKPTQRRVLLMLQGKPLRNSDLSRKIGISQPAIHKTVSSLAKSGIVELFADPTNKSAKLVRMTKQGERAFNETIKKISSIEEGLAQAIGPEKMQLLFEILECEWDRNISTKYDKEKDLVQVLLPRPAYELLGNLSTDMGKRIPEILDNVILQFSRQLGGDNADRGKIEKDWDRILTQIKNVKKKQIDESARFEQRALQGIEKGPEKEEALHDDKRKHLEILEHSSDVIYRVNVKTRKYDYINPSALRNWKMTSEEVFSKDVEDLIFLIHSDDRKMVAKHYKNTILNRPEVKDRIIEFRAKRKDGEYRWFSQTNAIVLDDNNEPVSMVCSLRDITERKKEEEKLLELVNQFERKVKDYSANLEESNSALRVLLKQYQKEKEEMEDKVLFNLKELVSPVIAKMKHHKSKDLQTQINTLEANLNQITSSFSRKMTKKHLNLTHQEIQVANHIMHGKTTKEIADFMGLAERTVDFHRAKIRKKMGLVNKKENLRTYLLSLQ